MTKISSPRIAAGGRPKPEAASTLIQALQTPDTANQKRWVDLSFKVTEDERDDFRLEAAKRRMTHKELFQTAMAVYREQHPVPVR
ncbi:hypothetical protein G3T14_20220 [Methylobacterium sp. BTF04]|uniref:hypothetical protein n=1 Tax=Methylobacterium sp. BTF04 TaxID=2708300 RepID=UPI0013D57C7A|nr:hypothetical protein [Methylobacterium sp. BTF04]NEU14432.1 hypothetical protein [Methylobacterium sp. BTF04]